MKYLLFFHRNSGYTNSPKCYVPGALPVLSCAIVSSIFILHVFKLLHHYFIAIFQGMRVHANSDLSTKLLTQFFNKQGVNCVFIIVDTTRHPTSIIIL